MSDTYCAHGMHRNAFHCTGCADESCHVCGGPKHEPGTHTYWSNADALAEAREYDKKSGLAGHAEAAYVAEYRPY